MSFGGFIRLEQTKSNKTIKNFYYSIIPTLQKILLKRIFLFVWFCNETTVTQCCTDDVHEKVQSIL